MTADEAGQVNANGGREREKRINDHILGVTIGIEVYKPGRSDTAVTVELSYDLVLMSQLGSFGCTFDSLEALGSRIIGDGVGIRRMSDR